MAKKTFISYKYSEARNLRDKIIEKLGEDATYYMGETAESPDMSGLTVETIKNKLKDMIYSTSVTIVIISLEMIKSNWIDWEIKYSLKQVKRNDKNSGINGVVGVVMKQDGDYSWLRPLHINSDGCSTISTNNEYLYDIIENNRFNQTPKVYSCAKCETVDAMNGSYIALVNEEDFLNDPSKYIDNAYDKSKSINYDISKLR